MYNDNWGFMCIAVHVSNINLAAKHLVYKKSNRRIERFLHAQELFIAEGSNDMNEPLSGYFKLELIKLKDLQKQLT